MACQGETSTAVAFQGDYFADTIASAT